MLVSTDIASRWDVKTKQRQEQEQEQKTIHNREKRENREKKTTKILFRVFRVCTRLFFSFSILNFLTFSKDNPDLLENLLR